MDSAVLKHALVQSGKQLDKIYDGLSEELMDSKIHEGSMTPRETLAHLCECYTAYLDKANGKEHEWGSYKPETSDTGPLRNECTSLRNNAVQIALGANSEEIRNESLDFLALHDAYHVGQLASLRLLKEEGWNPYSIYE